MDGLTITTQILSRKLESNPVRQLRSQFDCEAKWAELWHKSIPSLSESEKDLVIIGVWTHYFTNKKSLQSFHPIPNLLNVLA